MRTTRIAFILLAFLIVCSACAGDSTDDRVANVQQKLGLTDVKTSYLKPVLLEPIGNGQTRLDEAELLVQVVQQNSAIVNQEYFDMVNYWLSYITGKTVGGVQDMACTLLGLSEVCDLIGNLETMRDISKNKNPAIVLWNQGITRATIASYLSVVSSPEDDQAAWNEIIEPGIANQLAGYNDVGPDGKTNGQALHDYCKKVWLANENLQHAVGVDIPAFTSYVRSRTKGEAIIKITPTGSSTPITSAYAPCRVTFDGSASHATAGHSYTLQWTWPGGSHTSAPTQDRYYSTPDHYTVSLLVTQDDGWSWSTSVNFVVRSPRITVTPDAADYHKFAFSTDESPDITAYSWNFGDGTPVSNLVTPAHTYAADGDYTVFLTITTSSGNLSVSKSIHVGRTGPTRITVGTITGDEVWNVGGSPYLITSPLTIARDASLTVGPGVVVVCSSTLAVAQGGLLTIGQGAVTKLSTGGYLSVQGTLNALGTTAQPIYFTSYKDDSVGGDTNGDGNASSPAKGDWGGVLLVGGRTAGGGGTATLDHCVLRYGGSSVNSGNGYYIKGIITGYGDTSAYPSYPTYGTLTVSNSEISHSISSGIHCYQAWNDSNLNPVSVTGCTVSDCSGYGIYSKLWQTTNISGCSITGNTGCGVSFASCSPTLSNSIVAFNSAGGISGAGSPTLRNNDVYGNTSFNYSGISPGPGDIAADPLFVNRTAGDYHLIAGSPCIDAGYDAAVQPGWVDMDGQPRIQGAHVDIGAYEAAPTVAMPALSPGPGTYSAPQSVAITCTTPNAVIHYTTNGVDPTESDPVVNGPVLVDGNMVLKARAFRTGWAASAVQIADYTVFLLSQIKRQANGVVVNIPGAVVTAVPGTGQFYVESDDRSCGIMVLRTGHGLSVGKRVDIVGTISTSAIGEKYVSATSIIDRGAGVIEPLLLTNRDLGGADWCYDPSTKAGQKGLKNGTGLNNIGLLITTMGLVTYSATSYFYIDDGSALADNSGHIGIKVLGSVPKPSPLPPGWTAVGKYVKVTGISTCFKAASPSTDLYQQIWAREIVVVQ